MKAIVLENKKMTVKEIRGAYVYYINAKGQVKCIELAKVNIIDVKDVETKEIIKGAKKLNSANFMTKEEYEKSEYSKMSKDDFEDERERDKYNSISF